MKDKDMKDKEYIKALFDEDGIKAPDSLSEDAILAMLEKAEAAGAEADGAQEPAAEAGKNTAGVGAQAEKKWEPARRPRALRWLALAACAILVVVGVPKIYYSDLFLPDTKAEGGELYEFKSKSEIERIYKSLNRESPLDRFRLGRYGGGDLVEYSTEEMASEPAMNASDSSSSAAPATGKSAAGSSDHSETFLQVEDVDEADIVKVDGRYIYAVSNKQEVLIYETDNGKAKKLSTIGNNGIENYISDIFLKGDTLVAIGKVYDNDDGYVAVVSYDITDRSNPKLINQFRQSGDYVVSSRMVGDYVYIVSSTYAYAGCIVPKCTQGSEYKEMPAADISCVPNPDNTSYIVLSAVDISSGAKGKSKTKAVMGASNEIYCNNHNLYVTAGEWNEKGNSINTRIMRASLDGLKIKFNGTTTVSGYINNQFSMDEHDGYFRIATTADRNGMDVNNLYVLDARLNEVGKIAGFARDESIKAVRFMGSKAYVITYEAIDPLFIMDLSDPTNPRIEGEVKIDGFSSLLVPVNGSRLLGIGHATGDNGYGGQFDSGLKLALFDISNPSEPKVLDSKEFDKMESPAQSTHLALTVNKNDGYYAIPYNVWDYGDTFMIEDAETAEDAEVMEDDVMIEEPKNETGVLVFGISKDTNKIEVYDQHKMDAVQILRSPYIGDYIYGITGKAEIESFKFTK